MLPDTMRAVIFLEPGRIELQQVPVPTPGPGEILVRIRRALTCGTDVKTYRRGHPKIKPPVPFGHELAGDVVAVGQGVDTFRVGMRVVPHNSAPCLTCFACKHGQHSMCDNILFYSGAYAEYVVVPAPVVRLNTFEIPETLAYAHAALMEPLACVVHGQNAVQIQPGEHVAIIGAGGPIGLMHLQLALRRGAAQVIAVDLKDDRLAIARKLGATLTVNPGNDDPVSVIREATHGRGADVTIESAGAAEAWLTAIQAVRKGGRVLWFGGLPSGTTITLDTVWVHYGELSLYGVYHATPLDVARAFELIASGVIDVASLISGELPLEQVEEALQRMMAGTCVKMALVPDGIRAH